MKIEIVTAALRGRPQIAKLLVVVDFNSKLSESEGNRRGEDIMSALATKVLEDLLEQLLLRRRSWCWYRRTWSMIQEGREVRYQTD